VQGDWIGKALDRPPVYTLWIDRANSLLLRVRVNRGRAKSAETTIDYWPAMSGGSAQTPPGLKTIR
jgi:hypothetical protein